MVFLIFIQILIEHSVRKQSGSCSDAAEPPELDLHCLPMSQKRTICLCRNFALYWIQITRGNYLDKRTSDINKYARSQNSDELAAMSVVDCAEKH